MEERTGEWDLFQKKKRHSHKKGRYSFLADHTCRYLKNAGSVVFLGNRSNPNGFERTDKEGPNKGSRSCCKKDDRNFQICCVCHSQSFSQCAPNEFRQCVGDPTPHEPTKECWYPTLNKASGTVIPPNFLEGFDKTRVFHGICLYFCLDHVWNKSCRQYKCEK